MNKLRKNVILYSLLLFAGAFIYFAILLGSNVSSTYLWLAIPGTTCAILGYREHMRLQRLKLLAKLRRDWGGECLERDRKFHEISNLFEQVGELKTTIDDRTWHDLNMDLVFARIDRTFTWPGIQWLYQTLRSPVNDDLAKLKKRADIISGFQENPKEREDIQVLLNRLDQRMGSGLSTLLWKTPQVKPVYPLILFWLMAFAALLSPLLLIFGARYIILILVTFQINMFLHFKVQKDIKAYFEGVRSLGQLIGAGKRLARLQTGFADELLSHLKEPLDQVRRFGKIVRFVGVENTDPLMGAFQQYYTIFLLAEVRGFYRALDFIRKNQTALQTLFLVVGEIDALQSVASYRASLKSYCTPTFLEERCLKLTDAYHPLLTEPVTNSISVQERGLLVTGSNMSGKSTFLRTVGLNALLAQTIVTCLAKQYEGCPVVLLTSIGRADNVVEGKSYYLEEALGVRRILDSLNKQTVTLAIFDEMFRGTNSEERIFAGQRVLEYLIQRNAFVFVATHDLELASLLADKYVSMHFSERVGALGLEFDYKIKKRPSTTKNAIALLRYLEYPKEITDKA